MAKRFYIYSTREDSQVCLEAMYSKSAMKKLHIEYIGILEEGNIVKKSYEEALNEYKLANFVNWRRKVNEKLDFSIKNPLSKGSQFLEPGYKSCHLKY